MAEIRGFSITGGDTTRLLTALHDIAKAVDGLPETERRDVLRAVCTMYGVVPAKPRKARGPAVRK